MYSLCWYTKQQVDTVCSKGCAAAHLSHGCLCSADQCACCSLNFVLTACFPVNPCLSPPAEYPVALFPLCSGVQSHCTGGVRCMLRRWCCFTTCSPGCWQAAAPGEASTLGTQGVGHSLSKLQLTSLATATATVAVAAAAAVSCFVCWCRHADLCTSIRFL